MATIELIKKDYMVKRSQMKSRITAENYRHRWFELLPLVLRYSDGSLASGPNKLKGEIYLHHVTAVEKADSEHLGNRKFAFQVVYRIDDTSTLYIMASSEAQQNEWINAIRTASTVCGASFSAKYHPGVWLTRHGKFSCCDSINKRSEGCQSVTWQRTIATDSGARAGSIMRPLPPPPAPIWQSSNKVLALYNYRALEAGELQLEKGEEYELLEEITPEVNWCQARNKFGEVGYIPTNYIQLCSSGGLDQYDWFCKNTSRTQSEYTLETDGREGSFLVRPSTQKNMYTLSVFTRSGGTGMEMGVVKHYHIRQNAEGLHYLAEKHPFTTIPELIYYHKHNCAGLVVRLRFPPGDRQSMKPVCGLSHDLKEIDLGELQLLEELGTGNFGTVRRGRYKNEVDVAVKMMKEGSMQEADFIDEAKTMMMLQHPNLVRLYGVCTKCSPILILTEYMRNGALLQYLRRHKSRLLANTDVLIEMCDQVCSAMVYLEGKSFIHRDLAARNCLVGDKNVVKVGDFGLARFVLDNEYTSSAGARFPVRWSAPEILNYTRFSSKSDVWAFGVLMWEVFTCGEMPYGKTKNADVINNICFHNDRLPQPQRCPDPIFELMHSCWLASADQRPSFADLYEDLRVIQSRRDYE